MLFLSSAMIKRFNGRGIDDGKRNAYRNGDRKQADRIKSVSIFPPHPPPSSHFSTPSSFDSGRQQNGVPVKRSLAAFASAI